MKITDIKAIPLYIPVKEIPPFSVGTVVGSEYHVLVKVFTDEGITGYGEAWRLPHRAVSTFIEEALKPLLVGENPLQIQRLWDLMYRTTFRYGRKGMPLHCISGVEIALWDILGKYRKLPVYEMLGGACRDKIAAYASLTRYQNAADVAAVALRCVEEGYTAIKLHAHHMAGYIESVIKTVREAVGDSIALMIDVNGPWTPRQAVEKLKKLEQYGVMWVEEPVKPMDDYDGLAYVRDRSNVMIAAGENEYTRYGFRELLDKRAVDIVQPDITKAGGLLECCKILALAEAQNLPVFLHSSYYGPGFIASLHFTLASMRSEYIEAKPMPLEASFIQPAMRPEKGYITVSDKPGLGIEIDERVVNTYTVK